MKRLTVVLFLLVAVLAVSCASKVDTYGRQQQQADKAFGEMK